MNNDPHYYTISRLYEGKFANRTKLPYIKHIDDGLVILELLDAEDYVKQAWCLHPIFQMPELMEEFLSTEWAAVAVNGKAAVLAAQYAYIANLYRTVNYVDRHDTLPEIKSADIKRLLITDKTQNFIELENTAMFLSDEKLVQMSGYFDNWKRHLGISDKFVKTVLDNLEEQ